MRNGVFLGAIAVAVIGGGLIGWFGDFSAISGVVGAAERPAAPTPADPFAPRVDGLDFSIDMTRNGSERQPPRPNGYVPMGDRGYEPNGCAMPRASETAQVMLVGLYSGDAISTVALETRDEETGLVEVVIEPGTAPLYVVLSNFSPTIWRFSGAVERVERVVMAASKGDRGRVISHPGDPRDASRRMTGAAREARRAADDAHRAARGDLRRMTQPTRAYAGVVGLAPDRVSTSEDIRCFQYFSEADSPKTEQATKVVRRAAGRAPDVTAAFYSLAAIRLPSGTGARVSRGRSPSPPHGFDRGLWREAIRFSPAGLADLDAAAVISAVPVMRYDVLPSQMGLSQLVGAGDLEKSPDGLRIVRPLPRFPAGLTGAHATAFLLARDVPMPAGDPGHSCVILENGGSSASPSPMC